MGRFAVLVYGLIAYVIFLATFLYAMGFVEGYVVPKNINTGTDGPLGMAILINVALLGLFAIQHTIMARPAFKARWTKLIHPAAERSTFVLVTCVCLGLMFWLWQPMNSVMWHVEYTVLSKVLLGVSLLGWGIVLYSSFLIDHFDLFGVRQVVLHFRGKEYTHHPFVEKSLYKLVRHPLMTGFIIAFWAAPTMTAGHLLFAIVTTTYVVVLGIRIEEHDLMNVLGEDYHRYRRRTPMLIPRPWGRKPEAEQRPSEAAG